MNNCKRLLAFVVLIVLYSAARGGSIDDFNFPDAAAARQTWRSGSGEPISVVEDSGVRVMKLESASAAADADRVYIDRNVKLDLSQASEFTLRMAADRPAAVQHISLYFRSGQGWYGMTGGFYKKSWQTLRFQRDRANIEGKPAGWDKIDAVRIAFWWSKPENSVFLFDNFAFLTKSDLADGPLALQRQYEMGLERLDRVGHCDSLDELAEYVNASDAPQKSPASESIKQGREQLDKAREQYAAQNYQEAVKSLTAARESFDRAYLLVQPSPKIEARGWWCHSATGPYLGDWNRAAAELSRAGFNMVVPNMLWAGVAHYPSDVLPRSGVYEKYGDQIAQCLAAARKHGLEVHVWKVNHYLAGAPKEFLEKLRQEGRTQVSAAGEPLDWLCPSHPENFKLEADSMVEVAEKYDVDGLHFDYIRYPDGNHCYCPGCRARFEADSGRKVENWPADCSYGSRGNEFRQWRCDQITRLVAAVSGRAKKIRPGIKISAAVFGSYPSCRRSVGQDWAAWVQAGYLDFLCPMNYTTSDPGFESLVKNQLRLIDGRVPLYPGIGATATGIAMTPAQVLGQINLARSLGAGGFTIFNLAEPTIQKIAPAFGQSAGREKAEPPHVKR